jgi:hypothetical protein
MGNCQAAEAAAVVIQHPGGKVERLHGPATAGEVMRSNPGHYVALVVLRVSGVGAKTESGCGGGGARITKVKLLKPKDALLLGQVYRLVTSQGACLIALLLGPIPPCFSLGDRRANIRYDPFPPLMLSRAQRWRRRSRPGGRTRRGGAGRRRTTGGVSGRHRSRGTPPPTR